MEEQRQGGLIRSQAPMPLTFVVQVPAEVVMYNLSEHELDTLASGGTSLHVVFFGITVGAFIPFLITCLTVPLADRLFATFVALTAVSFILAVYFGLRTCIEIRENKAHLGRIKSRLRSVR